jgi:hypothetical protein
MEGKYLFHRIGLAQTSRRPMRAPFSHITPRR